jgi:hypothetical protein
VGHSWTDIVSGKFELTQTVVGKPEKWFSRERVPFVPSKTVKRSKGEAARDPLREEKWRLLSPNLQRARREALAVCTLAARCMFVISSIPLGISATRPSIIPAGAHTAAITLSDPFATAENLSRLIDGFLKDKPPRLFSVILRTAVRVCARGGFKSNCIGYGTGTCRSETYNTQEMEKAGLVKRARNEAKREV